MIPVDRNSLCPCGSLKKFKKCCLGKQPKESQKELYEKTYGILLKTEKEINGIRRSCKIAANILKELVLAAKIGVTTNDLDRLSKELSKKNHVKPAALGYGDPPFPKSICTSLNEVICHGIPDDTPLKEGDILNIDYACIDHEGYFGDTSAMVIIGKTSAQKELLVKTTKECLDQSIEILKPGLPLNEIGRAIQLHAEKHGFSVVRDFIGHGVGLEFHEEPQIPHYFLPRLVTPLAAGMTFTIEPMINAGKSGVVIDKKDQWTARTVDSMPSAQWEHTVLITETGYEILTLPD